MRRKIGQPWLKVGITAGYLAFVFAMYRLGVRCLFLSVLGVPCPGCGMTRALLAVLRLDFAAALAYHPMVFALPLMYLYFLFDGRLFPQKNVDRAVWAAIGAGFLFHWVRLLAGV